MDGAGNLTIVGTYTLDVGPNVLVADDGHAMSNNFGTVI